MRRLGVCRRAGGHVLALAVGGGIGMKCVPQVGTVTVEDTDDDGNHDTADDEPSGNDDDHPPPRLMETVLRIIEAGSALDVILRLSTDERLHASVEMSVDPDEPDPDTFELLSWALNRFQPMECKVTQTGDTVATFDGQRHKLTAVEAAGPVHGDPRPDGEAPVAGILGTVLFDAMEHLRAVHAGDADGYDPQAAATTIADLGVPDCDLARRLHVDLTPVVDTAAVGEEVVFLATPDERLLVLLTSHPFAASRSGAHAAVFDRLRPRVLPAASQTAGRWADNPHGTHTDDVETLATPPRRTVADVAEILDEHGVQGPLDSLLAGKAGPLDGTPYTLLTAQAPSERALGVLSSAANQVDTADTRCELAPVSTVATADNPSATVVAVVQQWRIRATDDGLDASHEPVAVVGMLLLDTIGHLRSLHRGDALVYDPPHLAIVGRALRSPMWVSSELLRTEPEAHSANPAVELIWAVVLEASYIEDGDGGKAATVIMMPHDPLSDDRVSDAVRALLVDLRGRALANAAAELATVERQRPK